MWMVVRVLVIEWEYDVMFIVIIQVICEGMQLGVDFVIVGEKVVLICGVMELLQQVLNKLFESIFVVIEEVDIDNWGWGGLFVLEFW